MRVQGAVGETLPRWKPPTTASRGTWTLIETRLQRETRMSYVVIATMECDGVKIEISAMETEDGVMFQIKLLEGVADLNGFFIDIDNDGGDVTSIGSKANNMNGSDCEGVKLDGFDFAWVLGTVGGNDDDYTSGFVFLKGYTLDDVYGAQLGIRATSVGDDRDGSLKLTAIAEEPEPPCDNFPELTRDISHITLYFKYDTLVATPPKGDVGGDGYYTVKIDEWPDGIDGTRDLDDNFDAILAWVIANDPYVGEDTVFVGVAIKAGNVEGAGNLYALDCDPDVDAVVTPLEGDNSNKIDVTYDYDKVFAVSEDALV
jgi:hypothetical protein